jgi:hypothetical protein
MNGANEASVRAEARSTPMPFVGRRAQLSVIESAIVELGQGRATDGHAVRGPVGSGRSALLASAARLAGHLGWIVVEAAMRPGSAGAPPTGTAAGTPNGAAGAGPEATEDHVLGTVVREAVRAAATELANRRPGATAVRDLARLCDEPTASAPGARRLGLALGEAADESRCGVVLVVDDVDLAAGAQATVEALSSASRRALPFLVVAGSGGGFDPDGELVHLDLGPFDADELAELLAVHGDLRQPPASELVALLADCSDGWPGLAARMASKAPEHWPQVLEDVVGARLRNLVPAERRYLETVAQLGADGVSVVSVARALGDSTRFGPESSTLQATRAALTRAGLLCSPAADRVSLALAGSATWLRR